MKFFVRTRQVTWITVVCLTLLFTSCARRESGNFELRNGDRVIFLGDTFIEQEQQHGWIELMLTTRFADREVSFRNLGWSADTPGGASRFGLSLFQATKSPPDDGWKALVQQLKDARPTVAFISYGMASSFAGQDGLPDFRREYSRLLATLRQISPEIRITLLGPLPHENLGAPWPDPASHNRSLKLYDQEIRSIAAGSKCGFVSFIDALVPVPGSPTPPGLTSNGIHPTGVGYRRIAELLEKQLFGDAGRWRSSANLEPLRQAILTKNRLFFYRSRPENMAYIFGFRRHRQGQNAQEIAKFDPLIAAEEKRIGQLRGLHPQVTASAKPLPEAGGSIAPQPLPDLQVAPELEVTLWAETPMLEKPIQMNFDPAGRLWVATSEVYPQIEPGQPLTDKIVVLEDTKGAGRADKATIFADHLLIPTGVLPGDGGVYVAQSTQLLFLRDTDGDGQADERKTVLSGFGTEDTHHNLHTLMWGPDGRMYLNQSNNIRTHIETPHGMVRHEAGAIFRFDPRDQKMNILFRGWINPWGHQFDAFGQSFVTDGADLTGVSWAVPGATYHGVAPSRRILQSVSPGSYPKFCGLEIVQSRHFPADWQGDVITCDFRANRIVRFKLSDQGSGYITQEMPDLVRSTSDTFRPIDVKLGPDGALYVADWSNPIIQHGEVDFRDPRRDREHGRIWRIAFKNRAPLPVTDYTTASTASLLDALVAPESFARTSALRVLLERDDGSVRPALSAWTSRQVKGTNKLAALWLHQSLDLPAPALVEDLLANDDPRVRAAATRTLGSPADFEHLARLAHDPNPRVRLEAVRALGSLGTASAARAALQALDHPMDPFLDYALWLTVNELAEPLAKNLASADNVLADDPRGMEYSIRAFEPAVTGPLLHQLLTRHPIPHDGSGPWIELVGQAGLPSELQLLFELLRNDCLTPDATRRAQQALIDAARLRDVKPAGNLSGLDDWLTGPAGPTRTVALELAKRWVYASGEPALTAIATAPETPAAERSTAFDALLAINSDRVRSTLRRLTGEDTPLPVRQAAVVALAKVDPVAAAPDLLKLAAALPTSGDPAAPLAFWRQVLSIKGVDAALAAALPASTLPEAVARVGLNATREVPVHAGLQQALMQAAGLSLAAQELSPAGMKRLGDTAVAEGNPFRGELIFRRPDLACVSCHAIGGVGGKVGPDLTTIGASAQSDYLVESLIYPNARTKEGYLAIQVVTNDHQVSTGMVLEESDQELRLRTFTDEVVSIAKASIQSRSDIGSLMPAGLVGELLPDELQDLVKFLAVLGKDPDFDATRGGVARAWRLYGVDSRNQSLGIDRVIKGDPALPDWKPLHALVNGNIPASEIRALTPNRRELQGLFAAVAFVPTQPGPVAFALTGKVTGAWLNGEPVEAGPAFTLAPRQGDNVLVFEFDESALPASLRLESTGVIFLTW